MYAQNKVIDVGAESVGGRRGGERPPREVRTRLELLGLSIDHLSPAEVVDAVAHHLVTPHATGLALGSVNLDHIHHFTGPLRAGGGTALPIRAEADDSDVDWMLLIDGAPVARAARRATGLDWARLPGADLLPGLLTVAELVGARVGFLGGLENSIPALQARLATEWPALDVAGFWTPPRSTVDDEYASDRLADTIRGTGVDLLVVGLGKPRQEKWIDQHGRRSGAAVLLAFGAATDFLAGSATRAPAWMRDAGLEWLFRLVCEPRRLSRRYLREGPQALLRLRRASAEIRYDWAVTAESGDQQALAPSPRW